MKHIQVEHVTGYAYQTDVELAHHLAYLRPLSSDWQRVVSSRMSISPEPDSTTDSSDIFGNERTFFSLFHPHDALEVTSISTVCLTDRYADFDPDVAPAWEDVRESLTYALDRPYQPACEFAFPSPYVPRLAELRAYAELSFTPRRNIAAASVDLMSRINKDFKYSSAATDVHTPVLDAFRKRAGVCQDFTHIMLGCLRSIGLAAQSTIPRKIR